ncbi:MAG: GNAT family N-acetyltransferase [Fusobacteriaceae bacterium]|jgi:phosphinothricin acetyltransferase|nr:GNAT family N-acetyltransferase [Fusobacteriaceae bacterium]
MVNGKLRLLSETDAAEILEIYRPYVEKTTISFEYDVPSLKEFEQRIKDIISFYPYLVYIINDKIVGYAYAHRYQARAAYQWNAEMSIYLLEGYKGKSIGCKLYGATIEILKLQNVKNLYGIVTVPNPPSQKFHEQFGFKEMGIYQNTGFKCEQWHNVILFEKSIGEYDKSPKQVISIKSIEKDTIDEILSKYS